MTGNGDSGIYARIGARPVINAGGNTTIWGGSTPSVSVMRAMEEAGGNFVEMEELLELFRRQGSPAPAAPSAAPLCRGRV